MAILVLPFFVSIVLLSLGVSARVDILSGCENQHKIWTVFGVREVAIKNNLMIWILFKTLSRKISLIMITSHIINMACE